MIKKLILPHYGGGGVLRFDLMSSFTRCQLVISIGPQKQLNGTIFEVTP